MSKASQIIVLCEDKAQDIFVRRFLKKGWNVPRRSIRVVDYPGEKGSGKKHVEDRLPDEVSAFRSRASHASTVLLVVRDADEDSVQEVETRLDGLLDSTRRVNEKIVYLIPKWHIETWLAHLDGVRVNENEKDEYKKSHGEKAKTKECHPLIDSLAFDCKEKRPLASPPSSLVDACEEFERIRSVLQ
jgi:hypothetical protein